MATKDVAPYPQPIITAPEVVASAPAVVAEAAAKPAPASKAAAKPRVKKVRATAEPAAADAPLKHPWDDIPDGATQTYVVDLPAQLHCKLKWIGSMTWGSSMRKEVVAILEKSADERLKAMGIGK